MRPALISAFAALVGITIPATALADGGPDVDFLDWGHYSYRVWLMPDIDQRRDGLPNDGNMYCAPTAILNVCAYAGNHGFDDEVFCDDVAMLYYHWPTYYDEVSNMVATFGAWMDTDPSIGTYGHPGGMHGAELAMGDGFIVKHYGRKQGHWPRFEDMATWAVHGAIVVPIVGWYQIQPETVVRAGGHAVTATRFQRNGTDRVLGIHDPASDDDDLWAQSGPTREDYDIVNEVVIWSGAPYAVNRVVGYEGGGLVGLIDGFYGFMPHHAFTWDQKGIVEPVTPGEWTVSAPMQLSVPGQILGVGQDGATSTLYVLQDQGALAALLQVDAYEQTETPVLELPGIQDFVISPDRRVYVLHDYTTIACYRIRGDTLVFESETTTPAPMSKIAFSPTWSEIVGVSLETQQLLTWKARNLATPPRISWLPGFLAGEPSLTVDPFDGTAWLTSEGAEHIWGIERGGTLLTVLEHALIENVTSLSLTPDGNLLFGNGSATHEITPDNLLVSPTKWAQLGGGPMFVPSFETNHDDTMTGPEWRNELPDVFAPSIPACVADINGDGQVGVPDLLLVLARWDSSSLHVDITMDGVVGVADLLALLAAWGDCA